MLGSNNILGTDDGIILGSTTLGATDINTIGIDEGTDLDCPMALDCWTGKILVVLLVFQTDQRTCRTGRKYFLDCTWSEC